MSEFNLRTLEAHKRYLQSVVLALYRVSDILPQNEALRFKLREEALNTISHAEHFYLDPNVLNYKFGASLSTLNQYCVLAREQRWLSEKNFLIVENALKELQNALSELEAKDVKSKKHEKSTRKRALQKSVINLTAVNFGVSTRQKQLLTYLQEKNEVRVGDLTEFFPRISKRTIRRDLDSLVKAKLIARGGKTNGTLYRFIRT